MDTKTLNGIVCFIFVLSSLVVVIAVPRLPRQKRLLFAYMALCFFVFGGLEYFGIIHLERGTSFMTAWDWIRIIGGAVLLWETYRQRQKNPQKKAWVLFLIGSIGLVVTGAFRI